MQSPSWGSAECMYAVLNCVQPLNVTIFRADSFDPSDPFDPSTHVHLAKPTSPSTLADRTRPRVTARVNTAEQNFAAALELGHQRSRSRCALPDGAVASCIIESGCASVWIFFDEYSAQSTTHGLRDLLHGNVDGRNPCRWAPELRWHRPSERV